MRCAFLMLVVVACCTVGWAQEVVFYDDFETGDTSGWWAPARVGETGQVTCFDAAGAVIPCAGTGQDGDLRPGVAWPHPRFVVNGDGTVTDMLTGLVWLQNANCFGTRTWTQALADANTLASGSCGLSDGSIPGDWRLPSVNELQSLADYEFYEPSVSNAEGTAKGTEGDPFLGISIFDYWSSTTDVCSPWRAWYVSFGQGLVGNNVKTSSHPVWPVRDAGTPGWWTPARVGTTGQVSCYNATGAVIPCSGTGQDGDLRPGVAWPIPRFVINGDGTVTDMLTGLVWLQNANCFGVRTWLQALGDAGTLASGACGLTDGSVAGEWRLPSSDELQSLADYEFFYPSVSNAQGTAKWTYGDPFFGIQSTDYWSSTTDAMSPWRGWYVGFGHGFLRTYDKTTSHNLWPVRTGR